MVAIDLLQGIAVGGTLTGRSFSIAIDGRAYVEQLSNTDRINFNGQPQKFGPGAFRASGIDFAALEA